MSSKRIYESSSGDTWDLLQENGSDRTVVVHTPNLASGGRPSQVDVDAFLRRDPHSAENAALVALLAAMPDKAADAPSAQSDAVEIKGYIHDPKEVGGPYIAVVLTPGEEPLVTLHKSRSEAERELAAALAKLKQTTSIS